LGNRGKHELYDICKDIYAKGEWPIHFAEIMRYDGLLNIILESRIDEGMVEDARGNR